MEGATRIVAIPDKQTHARAVLEAAGSGLGWGPGAAS